MYCLEKLFTGSVFQKYRNVAKTILPKSIVFTFLVGLDACHQYDEKSQVKLKGTYMEDWKTRVGFVCHLFVSKSV